MDQALLRSYLGTVYEFQATSGPVRASLDAMHFGPLSVYDTQGNRLP